MAKFDFASMILLENEDYILINKPPFIATLEDRASSVHLLKLAKEYHPDAQVCHRIDKETSGIMAIAKHPEAYRSLSLQFEQRKVQKEYHAVVDGVHDFKDREVDAPIYPLGKGVAKLDSRKGKEANTYFDTLDAFREHTLLSCRPITGRMHQIRIHLSSIGAPILNDEQYGGKVFYLSSLKRKYNLKQWTEEQPLIKRFALHAKQLGFQLLSGEMLITEAPYPKDFRVLLKQLDKNR